MTRLFFAAICCLFLFLVPGCGNKKLPVTGKLLLLNGKPLPGGMIIMSPVEGGLSGGARGYVREDGTFTMSTDTPEDGSFAGKYKVLIMPPPGKRIGGEDGPLPPPPIHSRYTEFERSGIVVEITPEKHHFEFTLEPPGMDPDDNGG